MGMSAGVGASRSELPDPRKEMPVIRATFRIVDIMNLYEVADESEHEKIELDLKAALAALAALPFPTPVSSIAAFAVARAALAVAPRPVEGMIDPDKTVDWVAWRLIAAIADGMGMRGAG